MTEPECWLVVQRLLENSESSASGDLRHARECAECASLISQAARLESLINAKDDNPVPHVDRELVERTTTRATTALRRARIAVNFVIAAIAAAGAASWFIVAGFYLGRGAHTGTVHPEHLSDALPLLFLVSALLGVVLGLATGRLRSRLTAASSARRAWIPLLLVIVLLAEYRFARFLVLNHDSWFAWGIGAVMLTAALAGFLPGRAGLPYKRLGAGRQLSGVCAGIAEATRIPVAIIRLAFIVLFVARLSGFVLYIVLDLLMEVHPDDRASLVRFRIRRWWSSRFGEGEAAGV